MASCVAAHSEKFATSTLMMESSSRWPSIPVTLGGFTVVAVRLGEVAGAGDAAGAGVGDGVAGCALEISMARIAIGDNSKPRIVSRVVFFIEVSEGRDRFLILILQSHAYNRRHDE